MMSMAKAKKKDVKKHKIITCKATGSTLKPNLIKCKEEQPRKKLGTISVEESGFLVITDPLSLPEVDEKLYGEKSPPIIVDLASQLTFTVPKFPRERAGLGVLFESGEGVFDVYGTIKEINGERKIAKIEMILIDEESDEFMPKEKEKKLPEHKYPPCPPCPPPE